MQINVGIIGTGWCGGIRANTCAASALVDELHVAEINEERLKEIVSQTDPTSASTDYQDIINNESLDTIIISATPETTHYPMAKEALLAGKHVFLEKPLALALEEADELIKIQKERNLKFAIGYSQRFNHKFSKQSAKELFQKPLLMDSKRATLSQATILYLEQD